MGQNNHFPLFLLVGSQWSDQNKKEKEKKRKKRIRVWEKRKERDFRNHKSIIRDQQKARNFELRLFRCWKRGLSGVYVHFDKRTRKPNEVWL